MSLDIPSLDLPSCAFGAICVCLPLWAIGSSGAAWRRLLELFPGLVGQKEEKMIAKATTGPLKGFAVLNIDKAKFVAFFVALIGAGVRYLMGGKWPESHMGEMPPPVRVTGIDCSGAVRAALAAATNCGLASLLQDGSWNEDDSLVRLGVKRHEIASDQDYLDAISAKDGLLRVCIHKPGGRGGDSVGHVWVVLYWHGRLIVFESCGGHGPYMGHPVDHDWFVAHCDDVFVLG